VALLSLQLTTRLTEDYQNTHAIIFVVDASDRERISEARDELQALLKEDQLRDSILLVYANKQDLPDAMAAPEITEKLALHSIRGHDWFIQETCATSGEGLFEGNRTATVSDHQVLNG